MNKSEIADVPAFPVRIQVDHGMAHFPGMTYRQWLIGMALEGLCANPSETARPYNAHAESAIRYADAVIAQLESA